MSSKLERCMVTRETYTPLELKTKLNQHLSSEIKSDHLTRGALTSLELKTKLNQHLSSNENPDNLIISRVIESKLNQYLSSWFSDHIYISWVLKSDNVGITREMYICNLPILIQDISRVMILYDFIILCNVFISQSLVFNSVWFSVICVFDNSFIKMQYISLYRCGNYSSDWNHTNPTSLELYFIPQMPDTLWTPDTYRGT